MALTTMIIRMDIGRIVSGFGYVCATARVAFFKTNVIFSDALCLTLL